MDVKAYIKNCLEELELNYDYDEVSEVFHLVMATDLLNITVRFRALDDGRRLASWAWMDFGIPKEKCVAVLQFLNRKFSENYYYAHYYLLEDDRHVVFEYVCPVWDTMDVEVFRNVMMTPYYYLMDNMKDIICIAVGADEHNAVDQHGLPKGTQIGEA